MSASNINISDLLCYAEALRPDNVSGSPPPCAITVFAIDQMPTNNTKHRSPYTEKQASTSCLLFDWPLRPSWPSSRLTARTARRGFHMGTSSSASRSRRDSRSLITHVKPEAGSYDDCNAMVRADLGTLEEISTPLRTGFSASSCLKDN